MEMQNREMLQGRESREEELEEKHQPRGVNFGDQTTTEQSGTPAQMGLLVALGETAVFCQFELL